MLSFDAFNDDHLKREREVSLLEAQNLKSVLEQAPNVGVRGSTAGPGERNHPSPLPPGSPPKLYIYSPDSKVSRARLRTESGNILTNENRSMKSSALPSFETPVRETSRTESMIFGAGSLEHMVSGDFDSQSPLYFNIHRERLCAAEHSSHSAKSLLGTR